ncbi:MAG: nucleotide exchange factor GrpE [Bdellovibrionaceae bacterium]|nr:nucleotide exchange factor GrpE [Pseudobdellovibrionaceae bacterium]
MQKDVENAKENPSTEESNVAPKDVSNTKETPSVKKSASNSNEEVVLSPLEIAKKDATEWKTQYAYLKAEFENYKKNAAKEQLRLIQFGSENLILDILKISDLFEMALKTEVTASNYENVYKGFKMTAEELSQSLEKHGLKKIVTSKKAFDPHLHEAISSESSETVPSGHIIKEYTVGYTLHDKVIRPSQVIVSAPPSEPKDNEK